MTTLTIMTTLMTNSRTALGGLLALAFAPVFWPGDAAAHTCDDPFSTDLIAGQRIDAGDVKVCNDDTTLTITYEATYPWCLLKTDLHVATIPDPPAKPDDNIPQNKPGNPIPGHFAYGDDYGGCLEGPAVFEIPLDEIGGGVGPGDVVAIAAHAEVDDGKRKEGAWGEGDRFVERGNWAMYFTYEVQAPPEPAGCFCDSRTVGPSGIMTGADILAQLCPEGELGADVVFQDHEFTVGPRSEALSLAYAISASGPACQQRDGGRFTSTTTLTNPQAEACRAHLRASCGQPEP